MLCCAVQAAQAGVITVTPADVAPAAYDNSLPIEIFKVQNAGGRQPPVHGIHLDVKAKSAALVGTASNGMGVQKVLTHVLLLWKFG